MAGEIVRRQGAIPDGIVDRAEDRALGRIENVGLALDRDRDEVAVRDALGCDTFGPVAIGRTAAHRAVRRFVATIGDPLRRAVRKSGDGVIARRSNQAGDRDQSGPSAFTSRHDLLPEGAEPTPPRLSGFIQPQVASFQPRKRRRARLLVRQAPGWQRVPILSAESDVALPLWLSGPCGSGERTPSAVVLPALERHA